MKNQKEILQKLGIEALNNMQLEAQKSIVQNPETLLLSPTGTGKTLAFLLPIIQQLQIEIQEVQCLILVPSRELAIQIEQVCREIGSGYKVNSVYGGQAMSKDKLNLQQAPAILVGTPGRVADHLRKGSFDTRHLNFLVLDEFDKSLEIGFEEDMKEILGRINNLKNKILTSATSEIEIPKFVGLNSVNTINFLNQARPEIEYKLVISPEKDKLQSLVETLKHIGKDSGIIFCNFRDSIDRLSDFLNENKIEHACFHGGMEQKDRERALIKFRNASHQLLLATDLAARGIDIPEIRFIIHYHLPISKAEFTHRNGRTARMKKDGVAYILKWGKEILPDYLPAMHVEEIVAKNEISPSIWQTVFISGGRKDKISKGDIAGLFFRQGQLKSDELGIIEMKQDCAFAAVHKSRVKQLIKEVDNRRLKKKKVRIYPID
tara:strand:- start:22443 stop:23744 length:1302 start_codon:yes stop_codon:yes gene_type:complete